MKILVAAFITALLVFILATGWIEVVQPRLDLMGMASTTKVRSAAGASNTRVAMTVRDTEEDEVATNNTMQKTLVKTTRTSRQLRDEGSMSERSKAEVARQMEEVKRQEAKLVAREENLRMLYDDIRTELAAIEEIRRRSATELAIAEQKVLDAARGNGNLASAPGEGGQRTSQAKTAQTYIASLVQDLANRGSIDTAAGLLRGMKDREIAKVLTTLSSRDPQLANQLFEQIRTARQETTIRR